MPWIIHYLRVFYYNYTCKSSIIHKSANCENLYLYDFPPFLGSVLVGHCLWISLSWYERDNCHAMMPAMSTILQWRRQRSFLWQSRKNRLHRHCWIVGEDKVRVGGREKVECCCGLAVHMQVSWLRFSLNSTIQSSLNIIKHSPGPFLPETLWFSRSWDDLVFFG